VFNEQAISLLLGVIVGLLIINPPFFAKKAKELEQILRNQREPFQQLLVFFQVLVIPPIIFESSFSIIKSVKAFSRIGSILFSVGMSVMMTTGVLFLIMSQLNSNNPELQ